MARENWAIDVEKAVANSYRDFHVKGFDYICLERAPELTKKLYFFDGDVSKLPEVVSPHDHRYHFVTEVLAGASENVWFEEGAAGKCYNRFRYDTPLNGGKGFVFDGVSHLREKERKRYSAQDEESWYEMRAEELHTIRMVENETVLLLTQYEDVVPIGVPTSTFVLGDGAAPSLDGLYRRFTADEVIAKLKNFSDRTGIQMVFT